MANLSDADIHITAEKVGKELVNYINANTDTDYAIVYGPIDLSEVDENGDVDINSSSSGRWAYSNNLEGYFDAGRVKDWLGVNSDYEYMKEEFRDGYKQKANANYEAYLALIEAIKRTGGRVDIEYTDCDPATGWMGDGTAMLELVDGEVVFSQDFNEEKLSIARFAEIQGESEYWALEYIHGDEVAEAYDKYLKQCKKEDTKPADVDTWYDEIYEEE